MISVIIPIYNAEKHLKKVLSNLLNQQYKDFEVLLIDDGSTDCSGNICEEFALKDDRFKVIHQKNAGVSAARNKGITKVSGTYITFIDADDEIPENYLEELFRMQKETDADITICDVVCIENGREKNRFTHIEGVIEQQKALNLLLSRKQINSGPCAKLFKTDIVQKICFPRLKVYEDILFVKNAFENARKIVVTDKTEYRYIQNQDSAMHQITKIPSEDIIVATEELLKYIKNKKELSAECMYITLSHLFQYVLPVLKNNDESVKQFVNQVRKLYRKYLPNILKCRAFPWKEKVVFALFSVGINR